MEKLSLLVAVHVALTTAFVMTSQLTSADQSPSSSFMASTDEKSPSPSDVEWNELRAPVVDDSSEDVAANKRKWGNNKARMWGKRDDEKRKWGEKTSRLWGKRMDMHELAQLLQDEAITPNERAADLNNKRKWAKNKARMWGKRSTTE